MFTKQESERDLWVWTATIAIVLAVLDVFTPPNINIEVLYVGLVFISLWSTRRSFAYFVAAVATCLILGNLFLSANDTGMLWLGMANRLLTIAVLWGAAFLCQLRQQAFATESRLQSERENALKQNEKLSLTAEMLREKIEQLTATRDLAVYTLAKVAESRDMDAGRHLGQISDYSLILANELRKNPAYESVITPEFMTDLRQSSPLHDIGKVSISDAILLKPGRLTPNEFDEMKKHAVVGGNILQDVISNKNEATYLKMAAVVARCHHERFDGLGYPMGLSGDAIPLPAKIVALVDVYDALTSDRPYKKAYSPEIARDMIVAESGGQFDPDVVDAFQRCIDDFLAVQQRYLTELASGVGLAESLTEAQCNTP
jgi:HD-GYP domain-containing protein (c-di-GMP phosphodiesterase class II)